MRELIGLIDIFFKAWIDRLLTLMVQIYLSKYSTGGFMGLILKDK
jgi:hypothetical protein